MPKVEEKCAAELTPDKEKRYRRVVGVLIDRLAISQSYIDAIDHAMDIFQSLEPKKALLVTGMTDSARKAVFSGSKEFMPAKINTGQIIAGILAHETPNVRESGGYIEIRRCIESLVKESFNAKG